MECPEHLTGDARTAWERILAHARATGIWQPEFCIHLELVSWSCANYVGFARELRTYRADQIDPEVRDFLEQERLFARRGLAEYGLVPEARLHLASLTDEGIDSEIAQVCAQPKKDCHG